MLQFQVNMTTAGRGVIELPASGGKTLKNGRGKNGQGAVLLVKTI
jgi:hypothetical protein